jgi:hypothetical protein
MPAGMPTVSPGWVKDAPSAVEMDTHTDKTPAATTLINLLCIFAL